MELKIEIKKKHFLIMILLIATITGIGYARAASSTSSPNPGHPASEIGAASTGTWQSFAEGNYNFPGNLTVQDQPLLTTNCTYWKAYIHGEGTGYHDNTVDCPGNSIVVSVGAIPSYPPEAKSSGSDDIVWAAPGYSTFDVIAAEPGYGYRYYAWSTGFTVGCVDTGCGVLDDCECVATALAVCCYPSN